MDAVERNDRFLLGARARLIEDDREMAWAEKHVRPDPNIKWILGNFVEADNPNDNGHIFPLDDLKVAQQTIPHKPLNMLHHGNYIVGAYAAVEMLWPEKEQAEQAHPYIEALAAFWRHLFPEEYQLVQKAHAEGALYYSMEAIPETLNCPEEGCKFKEEAVAYAGRTSETYCAHMNEARGKKILNNPVFGAGAIIIPPVRPGWKNADISELSNVIEQNADEVESVYANMQHNFPHLDAKAWESMMQLILLQARFVPSTERQKLAKEGKAMPDGSFPIANAADLKNAIQAAGRAKNQAAVKAHILKRAKALGLTDLLPDGWQ